MPGPVTRDSISKCSPGNDLYSMIRNPAAKMPSKVEKPVDTLKSLQGQLERDAVAKLGKISQNFIFVARAGKFVFLAIAMPPYILFYGLPKWVLTDGLPNILHYGTKPFLIVADKFKKLFQTDQNKGFISHLKNGLTAISTKATEYIHWVNHASKTLFVHLKHQTIALGYRLLQPYLPAFHQSFKAAETATKLLLQKTYKTGDKNLEIAKELLTFAWKTAKKEWIEPSVEAIKIQLNKVRKKAKQVIEKPRLEIQKFKIAITRRLKKVNEVMKSVGLNIAKTSTIVASSINYALQPVYSWITPKVQWAQAAFLSGREKIQRQIEQIRGFLQNVYAGIQDVLKISREMILLTFKKSFEKVIPEIVKNFFDPQEGFKKKSREFFKKMQAKIKTKILKTKKYAHTFKKQISEWVQKIRLFLKYLGHQILLMPRRFLNLIKKTYQLMVYSILKVATFFRWMRVCSRVLARLAWQELLEKTAFLRKN